MGATRESLHLAEDMALVDITDTESAQQLADRAQEGKVVNRQSGPRT